MADEAAVQDTWTESASQDPDEPGEDPRTSEVPRFPVITVFHGNWRSP